MPKISPLHSASLPYLSYLIHFDMNAVARHRDKYKNGSQKNWTSTESEWLRMGSCGGFL